MLLLVAATALALDATPDATPMLVCPAPSPDYLETQDPMELALTIALGNVSFSFLDYPVYDNHHSVDHMVSKLSKLAVTTGTLADGSKAAVFVANVTVEDTDEESGRVKSVDHVATVMVCDVDAAQCTPPQGLDCKQRGCTATLKNGRLTVAAKHRVTYQL